MTSRRYWILATLLLSVALAARVGSAVWWHQRLQDSGQQFAMGDSDGYWHLAHDLAAGRPYEYGSPNTAVFRAPGYPWLLSWLADPEAPERNLLGARILGCLFGTGAVALVMGIARWWFDRATSLVAGALAALYPGGVTTSVLLLSEAPFMPLMMLALAALSTERAWGAVLAGVVSGVAILVRPSWALFLPFYYALCFLLPGRGNEASTIHHAPPTRLGYVSHALLAGVAAAVVMAPWWVRNDRVTGHFVPTTLQVGASLYDGLHPEATGASDTNMEFSGRFAEILMAEAAESDTPIDNLEYRLNQRLAGEAFRWAWENPGRVVELAGRKIARTWWPWPSAEQLPGGAGVRWVFAMGCLAILIPGGMYAWRMRVWRSGLRPFVIPVLYFTLLHAVFVGSVRYRQPPLFALVVLAAPQYRAWLARKKGDAPHLCEAPEGPFRQMRCVPFFSAGRAETHG